MIDIKLIRENPDLVKENIKKKFQDHKLSLVDEAAEIDRLSRAYQKEADDLRADRNKYSKQIGACMKSGDKAGAEELKAKVNAAAARLAELEKLEAEYAEKLKNIMMRIPNIIADDVPIGKDDSCNV